MVLRIFFQNSNKVNKLYLSMNFSWSQFPFLMTFCSTIMEFIPLLSQQMVPSHSRFSREILQRKNVRIFLCRRSIPYCLPFPTVTLSIKFCPQPVIPAGEPWPLVHLSLSLPSTISLWTYRGTFTKCFKKTESSYQL